MIYLYTTNEQFEFYKAFAINYFEFAKRRILKFSADYVSLEVCYGDYVHFTFANIRRPSSVFIYIDNIVAECGNGYNKNSICSFIIIAITHELFHLEQDMIQEMYKNNKSYHDLIECSTDSTAKSWLLQNKKEIDRLFGTCLDLSHFDSRDTSMNCYHSADLEKFYKGSIMNVIFRKESSFSNFERIVLNAYQTIYINFNNGTNFLIKKNGEYCGSSIGPFLREIQANAGRYDRYTVDTGVVDAYRDEGGVALVTFTISNREIYPMDFRNV